MSRSRTPTSVLTVSGSQVLTLRHHPDHYRVEIVDLGTGLEVQALSLDKVPGGAMNGTLVGAVLSPDGTVLSTVYRGSDAPHHHPGFVHVLDLKQASTFCVDLPAPFGAGTGDEVVRRDGDEVVRRDGDDILVASRSAGRVARIRVREATLPGHAVPVTATTDTDPPGLPAGVAATPGYRRLIAVLD